MSVPDNLRPAYQENTLNGMKAPRAVKRIAFNRSVANPGEMLFVNAPKLNKHEVLVPGSLALVFNIDFSGGHANNFLVQKVWWSLVGKLTVKFAGMTLDEMVDYDIYKTCSDLFSLGEKRDDIVPWGIRSEDPCKIRSNLGARKPRASPLKTG